MYKPLRASAFSIVDQHNRCSLDPRKVYDLIFSNRGWLLQQMAFNYRESVLEALARHGIRPTAETAPELVHEFLSDLYRFEIRDLRRRMLEGEIRKAEYAGHVDALRERYSLLGLPLRFWTKQPAEVPDDESGA
ncbi:MAG TPA: hypothetical protein VKM94_12500 [Blastocatellia bacterium]|nr:hypothetical protein [Blastocatellia bacterium]